MGSDSVRLCHVRTGTISSIEGLGTGLRLWMGSLGQRLRERRCYRWYGVLIGGTLQCELCFFLYAILRRIRKLSSAVLLTEVVRGHQHRHDDSTVTRHPGMDGDPRHQQRPDQ